MSTKSKLIHAVTAYDSKEQKKRSYNIHARGHKQITKHKLSDTCYQITLGIDAHSTIYSHHSIITL